MENLIATTVGAAIDRKDGDSGIKGAVLGYVAVSAVKSFVRIGALTALGYGVFSLARHIAHKRA